MKRFLAAAAAAATALPLLLVAGATPAAAADCRDQYAQGAYSLRLSAQLDRAGNRDPFIGVRLARVPQGSVVRISTRLVRGNLECSNERVGYYTRGRGGRNFVLASANAVDARGLTATSFTANDDFRYYTDFNINAVTRGARSVPGLVQVIRP